VSLPELLTPQELAELLAVPITTIYRWNYTGTGPTPLRVGRHVRYRADDVASWLERQQVPAKGWSR
jgi:excisionase family DNA binding protein